MSRLGGAVPRLRLLWRAGRGSRTAALALMLSPGAVVSDHRPIDEAPRCSGSVTRAASDHVSPASHCLRSP
ncbi:hypothetical protein PSP31121_05307 [Pandoraea sputorum]|uniref:Uncharacterized protein n=1 Tax=Pandoraea sputorum TaxID=93222 RepID=A0A5E5BH98_9BURK|nr:hypothetical protein PSP31121_05307 [Pandoraea sputorum]